MLLEYLKLIIERDKPQFLDPKYILNYQNETPKMAAARLNLIKIKGYGLYSRYPNGEAVARSYLGNLYAIPDTWYSTNTGDPVDSDLPSDESDSQSLDGFANRQLGGVPVEDDIRYKIRGIIQQIEETDDQGTRLIKMRYNHIIQHQHDMIDDLSKKYITEIEIGDEIIRHLKFKEYFKAVRTYYSRLYSSLKKNNPTLSGEELIQLVNEKSKLYDLFRSAVTTEKPFGEAIAVKNVDSLQKILELDISEDSPGVYDDSGKKILAALSSLKDSYLQFYTATPFEFDIYKNFDRRKHHVNNFLGSNSKLVDFWEDVATRLENSNVGITEYKENFKLTIDDEFIKILSSEDETTYLQSVAESFVEYFSKKELKNILFFYNSNKDSNSKNPTTIVRPRVDIEELKSKIKKELLRLRPTLSKREANKIVNASIKSLLKKREEYISDVIRNYTENKNLPRHLVRSRTEKYRNKLQDIAKRFIELETEPTDEEYKAIQKALDDAYIELFTVDYTQNGAQALSKTLEKIFVKASEPHEFFRELMGGDEVYLPSYNGFPSGDKIRITTEDGQRRSVQSVITGNLLVQLVSMKAGQAGTQHQALTNDFRQISQIKIGSESQANLYPVWKGPYREYKVGRQGATRDSPFQFSRYYADNQDVFDEVVKDLTSELDGKPVDLFKDQDSRESFRQLMVDLNQFVSPIQDINQFGPTAPLAGDYRLREYVLPRNISYIKNLYKEYSRLGYTPEEIREKIIDHIKVSQLYDRLKESWGEKYFPNGKVAPGSSYIGYLLKCIQLAKMEDEVMERPLDFIETKKGEPSSATGQMNLTKISEAIFEKFFNIPELKRLIGKKNYNAALKSGPASLFGMLIMAGSIRRHNGFENEVAHIKQILTHGIAVGDKNPTPLNSSVRFVEYRGSRHPANWELKLDLFQTLVNSKSVSTSMPDFSAGRGDGVHGLSTNAAGYSAGGRWLAKPTSEDLPKFTDFLSGRVDTTRSSKRDIKENVHHSKNNSFLLRYLSNIYKGKNGN